MKISKDRKFDLDKIPDIFSKNDDIANKIVEDIYDNYIIIAKDSKELLKKSIENNISKPLIMYNLLFMIEIHLKYFLIKEKNAEGIKEVADMGHNIDIIIRNFKKINNSCDVDELLFLLKKIKNKNNQNLDYNIYYNFKYNHPKNKLELIFDYKCSKKELLKIGEVIKWINLNLQIA